MKKIIKALALFISWLTLSPLLLILDGRWKLLSKWLRFVLFALSPLVLAVMISLGIAILLGIMFADAAAVDHFHDYHFTSAKQLENITGGGIPEMQSIGYQSSVHFRAWTTLVHNDVGV